MFEIALLVWAGIVTVMGLLAASWALELIQSVGNKEDQK